MVARKGLLAPQNTFLDTIAARFDGTHSNFVLGNAQVPNAFPIVYCSDGFCDLSGYPRAYIMQKGCACKFLYGPGTDEEKRSEIEKALEAKTELQVEVQFYKKNGNPFWCLVDLVPITNEKHEVVLFLASHKDITSSRLTVPGVARLSNGSLDVDPPPNFNTNRRRSRAVLYDIQGHYKSNPKKNKLKKINKGLLNTTNATVHTLPLPEYKTAAAKKPKWVFSHYGYFKNLWDVVILLATIYVAIIVPYNAAFHGARYDQGSNATINCLGRDQNTIKTTKKPSIISDVLVEVIFVIDILLNFRTTFVNQKGEVVSSSKDIAINYLRTWFFLDLVAALPFDLFDLISDLMESYESIHLLKLTRLLRLARLVAKVDRYSQYSSLILTLLMCTFCLIAHWAACIWYSIAEYEVMYDEKASFRGWMTLLAHQHSFNDTRCVPDGDAYITALYFTCTSLTTVGFGNVSANTKREKIFSVILMIIGALMHASIFGHVTNLIQRMYARKSEYDSKWSDLKEFTAVHSVPKPLKQKMQDYFQTVWSLNHGIDPMQVLSDYPEELRGDISMHLHKEVLGLPLFETASQGCQKSISLKIKTSFCAPNEYLVHKGDVLHNIFYLSNGSMEVVQDGMVVAILGKGDLVGSDIDKSISMDGAIVKSSADVRALTYCDLECINIPGLVDVLKLHQDFQDQFATDIQHDLTYNLREGFEAEDDDIFLNHGSHSRLPSISEESDSPIFEEQTSLLGPLPLIVPTPATPVPDEQGVAARRSGAEEREIARLQREMRGILDKFGKLTQKQSEIQNNESSRLNSRSPVPSTPITATKSVQTDFPVAMLESYVVKNRKRILALLNIPHDSALSLCSMPGKPRKTDQFDRQKSWNTIPCDLSSGGALPSPRQKPRDTEKTPLLNGDTTKASQDENGEPEPGYEMFRGGKRCSEGDIARQACRVPLLSNGTSCSLVNERKLAITDF